MTPLAVSQSAMRLRLGAAMLTALVCAYYYCLRYSATRRAAAAETVEWEELPNKFPETENVLYSGVMMREG